VFANFYIWLGTRNWKPLVIRALITYVFMLVGVLGANLMYSSKPPRPPAMLGYLLLLASYTATAAVWSRLRAQPREDSRTNPSSGLSCGGPPLENAKD
jgi:hypothetical protein